VSAGVGSTIVRPAGRRRGDRAGDPLDGLVNLFDLGIVLAVAFLLAALSSLKLSDLLTSKDVTVIRKSGAKSTVIVKEGERVKTIELTRQRALGRGEQIGSAYRLADGRVVIVRGP
jgi:hypothetical protein